mgnify:CR=1 FL=1
MKATRILNCVFVGHVDHGKTSLLDRIRGTSIAKHEPGLITQSINAYNISTKIIEKFASSLIKEKLKIQGILAIDSPGHAAFTNLRRRGGSLADIAVLVIDINDGFKPQTHEALEILKHYKTPFVIALNKIDLIPGWHNKDKILIRNINLQSQSTIKILDGKLYSIVGKLYELGFNAERFDKVEDYTKQIAIIPLSAKTGEGIGELLLVLAGLAQKFLEKNLQIETDKPGKGTILEVRDVKGLGKALDVILYDGNIKEGDKIVIGGIDNPIETKVRGIQVLRENKFEKSKQVNAANAIRINAPGLEQVYPGMPLVVANFNTEQAKKEVQKEVEEVLIETDKSGIIVKADSLGSLEGLINLLKQNNIKIKKASIGEITKDDLVKADSEKDELNQVVLGFNIKQVKSNIKVITSNIIYTLLDELKKFREEKKKEVETRALGSIIKPFKVRILHGYIFRQSNPAVVGVEVMQGTLKKGVMLIKDNGASLVEVKEIQNQGKTVTQAEVGKQVAVALQGVIVGRQIHEGEIFYSDMNEENFRKLKKMKSFLKQDEIECLKEILEIKRRNNTLWGV